uniref:Uncharacterized protein n=1 Tax=Rhizophora mucronata TaxID=61149 RepID=A0A2P2QIB0_RHIMU
MRDLGISKWWYFYWV